MKLTLLDAVGPPRAAGADVLVSTVRRRIPGGRKMRTMSELLDLVMRAHGGVGRWRTLGYSVIDLGDFRDGGLIQQAGGPLAG